MIIVPDFMIVWVLFFHHDRFGDVAGEPLKIGFAAHHPLALLDQFDLLQGQ
jgi:hypothetical protein